MLILIYFFLSLPTVSISQSSINGSTNEYSSIIGSTSEYSCHSCFSGCRNWEECDCDSSTYCRGEYCYVKLDRLSEDGVGTIRKGCVNEAPSKYLDHCQYAGDNSAVECYCRGEHCNEAAKLNDYRLEQLPLVTCCECDGYVSDNGSECLADRCLRNCTGNYCYNELIRESQGCGWGYSMGWQFLRNSRLVDTAGNGSVRDFWSPHRGDMTCVEGFADWYTNLRTCTCAEDYCNLLIPANEYLKNETQTRDLELQQDCYAVHNVSNQPTTLDAFRESTTCPGHFCFITITTVTAFYQQPSGNSSRSNGTLYNNLSGKSSRRNATESTGGTVIGSELPKIVTRYELTAGCLLVDDDAKVELGCTTEWTESEDKPTKKHCICKGHICNYLSLITGEDRKELLAFDWGTAKYRTAASSSSVHSNRWIVLSSIAVLIWWRIWTNFSIEDPGWHFNGIRPGLRP